MRSPAAVPEVGSQTLRVHVWQAVAANSTATAALKARPRGARGWPILSIQDEVIKLIREALELYIDGLRRDGDPVPPPQTTAIEVDVPRTAEVNLSAAV